MKRNLKIRTIEKEGGVLLVEYNLNLRTSLKIKRTSKNQE